MWLASVPRYRPEFSSHGFQMSCKGFWNLFSWEPLKNFRRKNNVSFRMFIYSNNIVRNILELGKIWENQITSYCYCELIQAGDYNSRLNCRKNTKKGGFKIMSRDSPQQLVKMTSPVRKGRCQKWLSDDYKWQHTRIMWNDFPFPI